MCKSSFRAISVVKVNISKERVIFSNLKIQKMKKKIAFSNKPRDLN